MCFAKLFGLVTKEVHQKAIADLRKELKNLLFAVETNLVGIVDQKQLDQNEKISELFIAHNLMYHAEEVLPPISDLFDPKAEVWQTELGDMKLGFVTVKRREDAVGEGFPELNYVKNNVLYEYENIGSNTAAKRINVNPKRFGVAVNAKGTDYHYGDPRPFGFNDGIMAYEVCPKQTIDGIDLETVGKSLYIKLLDVATKGMTKSTMFAVD